MYLFSWLFTNPPLAMATVDEVPYWQRYMSGRTVGSWMLIYVTLLKSIRKAPKVDSRVCILSTAFVSALETKKFNLFIKSINKESLSEVTTVLSISCSVRTWGTYWGAVDGELTRLLHDEPRGLVIGLLKKYPQFIVCILSTAFVSALETKKFNLFIKSINKESLGICPAEQ
jgi:hypothetical protein